jgi:hypothetical protein
VNSFRTKILGKRIPRTEVPREKVPRKTFLAEYLPGESFQEKSAGTYQPGTILAWDIIPGTIILLGFSLSWPKPPRYYRLLGGYCLGLLVVAPEDTVSGSKPPRVVMIF